MNIRSTIGALALSAFAATGAFAQTSSGSLAPAGLGPDSGTPSEPNGPHTTPRKAMKSHSTKARKSDTTQMNQGGTSGSSTMPAGTNRSMPNAQASPAANETGTTPAAAGSTSTTAPGGK